jgi:hypothetical protein
MSARLVLRLALAVAIVAAAMSLSGCVFFSNAFWLCAAGDADGCQALAEYTKQSAGDWDGDDVENGSDECPILKGNPFAFGCTDGDGDHIPDHRDACPDEIGETADGCPFTPPPDTTAPPPPAGLTAVGQGSRIRLDWIDVIDVDLAGYHVERSTKPGGPPEAPYEQLTSMPLTASTYDDTAIDPNTTYYYVVTTVDRAGNRSVRSAEVHAKGCEPPECTPSDPGGLSRSASGSARISLAGARKTYTATVRGRFARARSFNAENGVLRGRALIFRGRLAGGRGAPKGLRRATWAARMDLTFSTTAARATARGIAVAKFGRANQICMRFTQRMRVAGGGRRVLGGSFSVVGATGAARQLASASRFSGAAGRRGAWTLRASGNTGKRLPRALPRACRGL